MGETASIYSPLADRRLDFRCQTPVLFVCSQFIFVSRNRYRTFKSPFKETWLKMPRNIEISHSNETQSDSFMSSSLKSRTIIVWHLSHR